MSSVYYIVSTVSENDIGAPKIRTNYGAIKV